MFHSEEIKSLPDLLALHQQNPDAFPYLLASNTAGQQNTRYSILMAYPESTHIQKTSDEDCLDNISVPIVDNPIRSELPFIGGWFIYLSYEYASVIEPTVNFHKHPGNSPLAVISRVPAAIIIDHELNKCILVSEQEKPELISRLKQAIHAQKPYKSVQLPKFDILEEDPEVYLSQLERIKHYIIEGDIFQANLSREWKVKFKQDCQATDLYDRLRQANPAPFAALIKINKEYIVSSSPERLVSVSQGRIETRPIAGTHPRGKDSEQDQTLAELLISHPKERAEHVMLIDLERNDLGRVCKPGTIKVQDKMVVESYQHVHHIVSSIGGELEPHSSVQDVIHAVFPGGTITGCPKVRCMEIISELEQQPRMAYTGSVGYVSNHGNMDMNILIRTMSVSAGEVSFRAGAGIVSDSIAVKELNETRHKVQGLINAIQFDH